MSLPCRWLVAISCAIVSAQQQAPRSEVAGIPVNYDEAKVGTYTLPDPLVLADGKPVRDAKTWIGKTPARNCAAVRGERVWTQSRASRRDDLRRIRERHAGVRRQGDPAAGDRAFFGGQENGSAPLSAGSLPQSPCLFCCTSAFRRTRIRSTIRASKRAKCGDRIRRRFPRTREEISESQRGSVARRGLWICNDVLRRYRS